MNAIDGCISDQGDMGGGVDQMLQTINAGLCRLDDPFRHPPTTFALVYPDVMFEFNLSV